MATLTAKERDALLEHMFAVPGKRALPMHDAANERLIEGQRTDEEKQFPLGIVVYR